MTELLWVLLVAAMAGNAVVYGTDVFCAIALRPALAQVDDAVLVSVIGQLHRFADQRMPIPGAVGLGATVAAAVVAAGSGQAVPAMATGLAIVALVLWALIYLRVSAPVNKRFAAGVLAGEVPAGARKLQQTWDSVINARVCLQTVVLLALCIALVTAR